MIEKDSHLFVHLIRNKYIWNIIGFYLKFRNSGNSSKANPTRRWISYEDYRSIDSMITNGHLYLLIDKLGGNQERKNKLVLKSVTNSLRNLFRMNNKLVSQRKSIEKSLSSLPIELGSSGSFHICPLSNSAEGLIVGEEMEEEKPNKSEERLIEIREQEDLIVKAFRLIFCNFKSQIETSCFIIDLAVESRSLEIVKMLHHFDIQMNYTHDIGKKYASHIAMDVSSRYGDMEILEFLHQNRGEGASKNAMDLAASNNNLSIVEFLHTHRNEGATQSAVENAAMNGHYEVVKFLTKNRQEGFRPFIIDHVEKKGYTNILNLLYQHQSPNSSPFSSTTNLFSSLLNVKLPLYTTTETVSTQNSFEDLKKVKKKSWVSWNWS